MPHKKVILAIILLVFPLWGLSCVFWLKDHSRTNVVFRIRTFLRWCLHMKEKFFFMIYYEHYFDNLRKFWGLLEGNCVWDPSGVMIAAVLGEKNFRDRGWSFISAHPASTPCWAGPWRWGNGRARSAKLSIERGTKAKSNSCHRR